MNDHTYKPSDWQYYWDENHYVQIYLRRRFEPTEDQMPKPYSQILAYVQHTENGIYRALLHSDEINEMTIDYDSLDNIKFQVENYFLGNTIDK